MEDNRNGQLNNDGGAGQSNALGSVGIGVGQSGQRGQLGQAGQNGSDGNTSGAGQDLKQNDLDKEGAKGLAERWQQKVVSLKGEVTEGEIKRQKKVEAIKAGAVKLEGKKTEKELKKDKELEKLKAKAIKLTPAPKISNLQDAQDKIKKIQKDVVARREQVDAGQQVQKQEVVDDSVLKNKVVDELQNKNTGDNLTMVDKKTFKNETKQNPNGNGIKKAKQRMVISPEGKISWENSGAEKNVVNLKQEVEEEQDDQRLNNTSNGKVVNLKDGVSAKSGSESVIPKNQIKTNESRFVNETDHVGSMGSVNNVDNIDNVNKGVYFGQEKAVVDGQNNGNLDLNEKSTAWEKKKVDLSGLSVEDRIKLQATPSLASVNEKMDDDTNGEMTEWFEEYNKLPVNIKLGLGDGDVRQAVLDLAKKFGLDNEEGLGEISRIIRDVYVDLIGENEIRNRANNILKISSNMVGSFLKGIALVVALVREVGTEKSLEYFDKLSVDEILEKYPKVVEKKVTLGQIAEKNSDKYVEPTLKNWLNDYVSRAGADKHNNLERGKYLTDSPNVKHLEREDKEKIEMLTRSYDEGIKLVVDPESEDILWQLHTDESALGINSDEKKRVINNFKIDEAQTIDVDKFMNQHNPSNESNNSKVDLGNVGKSSIMKEDNISEDKNKKSDDGVLDLSSEIEVGSER